MLPAGGVGSVRDMDLEHPDITATLRTGYPSWIKEKNQDAPEILKEYADEYSEEIIKWLLAGYPDMIREFSDYAKFYNAKTLEDWLN